MACEYSGGTTRSAQTYSPPIHQMPPSEDRGKLRSLTYRGIAEAMADQWGAAESWPIQAQLPGCTVEP